ncbi:hypothetical protein PENSPDRAFT_620915 [Peniophora sp. CONT]|nr:hypothetical protein PENSPDRAFT_620915 [Peniophora sp. CONT]
MTIKFGSFDSVCEVAALVPCPLIGGDQGIEPTCYSRNVEIGGFLFFQPSTFFVHIVALVMTAIMVYHIRGKYTAVGRKEILTFFYLYALIELLAIFLDTNIIPSANQAYVWFAAIYTGLIAAAYACLVINGFVGFQFAEDGTPMSLWFMRIACLIIWGVGFFVAIATFKSFAGLSPQKGTALWIVYLLWPLICTAVYVISQLILVFRTLEDRWPIGDIVFGAGAWAVAQILLFAFSVTICNAIKHYIDGIFFFSLCMLLSVMMVYKYWDSITREDLEFSVGSKAAAWEVKDPLLAGQDSDPYIEDSSSAYHGAPASLVGGVSGQQLYQQKGYGPGRGYPPPGQGY